jgi:hypothetical protein
MPVQAYKTRILIDQFDFSMETAGGSLAMVAPPIDAPALQQAARLYIPGVQSGKLEFSGYWNGGAAGRFANELEARHGSSTPCVVAALLDAGAAGNPAYVLRSTWGQQLAVEWPAAGLLTLNAAYEDVLARGLLLYSGTTTTTGVKNALDFPAGGSDGGEVFLFVQAIGGTATNAEIAIASAPNEGGTFVNEATLLFSAVGAYRQPMSGAVDKRLRVSLVSLGGATSLQFAVVGCIKGVSY